MVKRKAGTQRATQYTQRRMMVAADYLRGKNQSELADEHGVSQSTISRDLEAIRQEWLQSALVDFNAAKAQELAKIDNLETEYWQAWGESTKVHNDAAFLRGVQWCIEQRCKLFGLYEAAKVDITWREEAERAGVDTGNLFEELVQNYVAALASGHAEDAS